MEVVEHYARGGVDEAAVGGVALDQLGIELDADARGEGADDVGQVDLAAGFLEAILAGEFMGDGDLVDRLVPVPEVDAGFVDPAVLLAEEVSDLEDGGDAENGFRVDEEGAEDGLLSLDIVRG